MKKTSYICDRCGKEKTGHVGVNIPFQDKVIQDVGWVTICSGTGFKRNLDLCEDCIVAFKNWLENESQNLHDL